MLKNCVDIKTGKARLVKSTVNGSLSGPVFRLMIAASDTGAEIYSGTSNVPGVTTQIPGTILTVNQVG